MTPAGLFALPAGSAARPNPPPEACLKIGQRYLAAPDASGTATGRRLYAAYAAWTARIFALVRVVVDFTERDPYRSAAEMRERVLREGAIRIFSGGTPPPGLSYEQNLKGRAVHDLLAHLVCGCPFTATGEFNAFEAQAALYPVEVRPLLFCEIVGQTCAYLVQGEQHAEQKLVLFAAADEEAAGVAMRRQFSRGLGLAGTIERGLVDPAIFELALETGYALRYPYAVLETQSKAKVEAALANRNPRRFLTFEEMFRTEAPRWARWLA